MLLINLWKKQPGKYFGISTKSATGVWKDYLFDIADEDEILDFIRDNRDKDLYMTAHGFNKPRRKKQYAVDPCLLYCDLDEVDPRNISIRPTIAIRTSPGRYVGYWLTDYPASEDLNRRLTYWIGADKGGWDRTQVLRIPGTRNYKYETAPRVRLMWDDGPTYKIHDLEKKIPKEIRKPHEEGGDEVTTLYKRYENKLDRWTRRELLAGKPREGRRSEVLWKLHNKLIEAGISRDEAFVLLWASPWNKFFDRRNGEEQLRAELDKAVDGHINGHEATDIVEPAPKWNPIIGPISEVEQEEIEWLIPGFLPRREITIVEGDPGLGKSYLVQMISAKLVDGKRLPVFDHKPAKPIKVIHFDTENTASTVTKQRLVDNKCKNLGNFYQSEEPFSIDDPERWGIVIERLEELKPDMIVFDTINIYIGMADTYRSSETQQAMAFFKQLAVQFNCAVVVLRHLTKGKSDKAIYRGQGSIAFTGTARIVATVGQHPEDEELRVVACTKNNISPKFKSFSFAIDPVGKSSRFRWGEEVEYTADELMDAGRPAKNTDKQVATEILSGAIESEGRVEVNKAVKMAEARGISRSTMYRAAQELGVKKDITGFGSTRQSWWSV